MSATTQSTSSEAANGSKSTTTPIGKETMEKVRSDLASLGEEVKGIISQIAKMAATQGEAAMSRGKALADDATDRLVDARASTESLIRRHPLAAIGIAVGVGVIIAAMSRKK